jgi:L-lactate dehydrogenase complex protein LldG
MTSSREEILARIRAANRDNPTSAETGPPPVPRGYQTTRTIPGGLVERFCERVADYRAKIQMITPAEVSGAVLAALSELGAHRVAIAEDVRTRWQLSLSDADLIVVPDDPDEPLDVEGLQRLDAVVTGAAVGIAETGTVVLDGGPACGRRALTLVPDAHICLIPDADIVDDVPAALARLRPARPLTWISGPSATSDIELNRVEGVHGPRRLHVLVILDT